MERLHFFNAGIGTHHGDWLLLEIGSTASAVSYPLGMWGSWSGYGRLRSLAVVELHGTNSKIAIEPHLLVGLMERLP